MYGLFCLPSVHNPVESQFCSLVSAIFHFNKQIKTAILWSHAAAYRPEQSHGDSKPGRAECVSASRYVCRGNGSQGIECGWCSWVRWLFFEYVDLVRRLLIGLNIRVGIKRPIVQQLLAKLQDHGMQCRRWNYLMFWFSRTSTAIILLTFLQNGRIIWW